MISRIGGTLVGREADRVEVETAGGVVYEVEIPLSVFRQLPGLGEPVSLRTCQIVSETSVALYGFQSSHERSLFRRLLTASGVGPRLALAMMSTFPAERLARALVEKDLAALQQVSGVGRKKAEKIALELSDKVADLAVMAHGGSGASGPGHGGQEAVRVLMALGYSFADADEAVREVLAGGVPETTDALVRQALARSAS